MAINITTVLIMKPISLDTVLSTKALEISAADLPYSEVILFQGENKVLANEGTDSLYHIDFIALIILLKKSTRPLPYHQLTNSKNNIRTLYQALSISSISDTIFLLRGVAQLASAYGWGP